jgi:dihydrofolate reductase
MRKVIMDLAISFDGMIEGPHGEIDWIIFDKEGGSSLLDFLQEIDSVFYGRVSYELWGTYQPPEESADYEKHFYEEFNKLDKFVFSTTQIEFPGNPVVIRSDIAEFVNAYKSKPGKHIWLYGGAGLITTFLNLNLVDELRVAVMPVILGQGKPLFKDILQRHPIKLVEINGSPSGVVWLHYKIEN